MNKLNTPKKIGFLSAVVVVFVVIITGTMQENIPENETYSYDGPPRAAIIDQLHYDIPSKYFQDQALEYLETAGYEVEIFTTEQLTVDFYKKLPTMNYELIVFRSHAIGNNALDPLDKEKVSLFTGEKYRDDKYISEQLAGQISKGAPYMSSAVDLSANLPEMSNSNQTSLEIVLPLELVDESNPYFLIGSKYVDEVMEGKFPNSLVILGGCSTLSKPTLADSFINRGASSVIGWDDLVGSVNNDQTMLAFLESYLIDEMEIQDAVEDAMTKSYQGTHYKATFSLHDSN